MLRRNARRAALAVAVAALAGAAAPAVTQAQTAPLPPCTSTIGYDASIPTWQQFWAANPDPDAVVPLGWGSTGSGGGANANGSGNPGPTGRNLSRIIDKYWDGLVAATANNPRVRLIKKPVGKTATGLRDIQFYVLATPQNIDQPRGRRRLLARRALGRDLRGGRPGGRGHQARVRLDHGHPARRRVRRGGVDHPPGLRAAGAHGLRERAAPEAARLLPAARPQPGRP